jgi:mannose-6-phosphate isomerase-like protein (cupin superfamily)
MKNPDGLDPLETFVHLRPDGSTALLPGGEAFWSLPPSELERIGRDWMVLELAFDADWPNWEMHPHGDEFVYLLSGSVDLLLEEPGGAQTLPIRGRGAVVIPKGVWHTAKVHEPSRMLHITLGDGTQSRRA